MTVLKSLLSTFRQSRPQVRRTRKLRRNAVMGTENLEQRLLLVNSLGVDAEPPEIVTASLPAALPAAATATPVTIQITQNTIVEPSVTSPNPGPSTTTARVVRPTGQPLGSAIVVDLINTDPTEISVPNSVTIPAGQTFASFTITAVDDDLLDGDQPVTLQAAVGGMINSSAVVIVRDHEFLTINFESGGSTITSVREDAGSSGASIRITRSNTDVSAPSHWVSSGDNLLEYDPSGNLLRTIPVEWPGGVRPAGQDVRDVLALPSGNVAVYNGTAGGNLSVYNTSNDTWNHFAIAGLSSSSTDVATGGLASFGNYVFLTDMETSFGDPHGLVRLDLLTGTFDRFAENTLGARLFANNLNVRNELLELHPVTGEIVNRISLSQDNSFFDDGLAFDGTHLWYLSGLVNELYKLDPDTGAILETHNLAILQNRDLNGLAVLNGLVYVLDNISDTTGLSEIEIYNPATRQYLGLLPVEALTGFSLDGGLGSVSGPDALIATSSDGISTTVIEIDPVFGTLRRSFIAANVPSFLNIGLTSISDVQIGGVTYNNLILIGTRSDADVYAYTRQGIQVDMDPATAGIVDPLTIGSNAAPFGVSGLGGGDVPGVTTADLRFVDVAVGLDGLVYGLVDTKNQIAVHDPNSLARVGFITLDTAVNTITVDENGVIYGGGANGEIRVFNSTGATVRTANAGIGAITDIDTNISQEILVTSIIGEVAFGDRTLTTFSLSETIGANAFASFGRHPTQSTGDVFVTLQSSDLTELIVPTQVMIPVGQQSVVVPVTVVDDNLLDGDQTVTVTATSSQYSSATGNLTVTDVETIVVNVVETQVVENSGANASQVIVSRTDVDGPLTFVSTQTITNDQSLAIRDHDTVESRLNVETQTSRITDVDVRVSFVHSFLQDLDVFLVSPNGTRVELFTDQGSNESRMTNTILDDEAGIRINDGSSPYTGRFRPEQPLSIFDGENPTGEWTLQVTDDNQQDVGFLLNWSLILTTVGLAPAQVTLQVSDSSEASLSETTVTIPANKRSVTTWLNAVDDDLLDGTQTVTVSATAVSLAGFELGSDTIDVTDAEYLALTVSGQTASEIAGPGALTGTVRRLNSDLTGDLTVTLTTSGDNGDPNSELTVPATVTIPDGMASANFSINAHDDALFDGDQPITITATAAGYLTNPGPGSGGLDPQGSQDFQVVTITDHEPALVLQTTATTVAESDGTLQLTVRRINDLDITTPQTVTLTSSDITELSFNGSATTTVVIPANSTATSVTVNIEADDLLDGSQTVTLNASGPAINPGSLNLTVNDAEALTLTLNRTSFLENGGSGTVTGTVTVSNTADRSQPVTVNLSSSDTSEATVPATVTIPANATSVTFTVTAVNDPDIDGPQPVTFTATAGSYQSASVDATVLDHEPPVLTGPATTTGNPQPTITWDPLPGATRYDLWVNYVSGGVSQLIRVEDVRNSANPNLPGTSYTPPAELGLGRYRAWVRAYDQQEVAGFWSVGRDFVVTTAPQILAPAGNTSLAPASFPEITWSDVVDITRYDLWVTNLTTNEHPIIRAQNLLTSNFQTTQNLPGGEYRAWVRAFGPQDAASTWSSPVTFAVLGVPNVFSPSGGTSNRTPRVEWNPIDGADHYEIWISNRDTGSVVVRDRFVPDTFYVPTSDLADQRHVVWVRAVSDRGFVSQWSPANNFTVSGNPELGRPVITTPTADGTTGVRPQFQWTGIANVDRYEIWVNRLDVPTDRVIYSNTVATNSFAATNALPTGQYRVWVRALGDSGEVSDWSLAVNFTVASIDSPTINGLTPVLSTAGHAQTAEVGSNRVADLWFAADRDAEVIVDQASAEVVAGAETARMVAAVTLPAALPLELPAVDELDQVLADWDAASWWSESEEAAPQQDASLAGLGLGLVAASSLNRRRQRRPSED